MRLITEEGLIIVGNIGPGGIKNGWCITFSGFKNMILIGWYDKDGK